MNENAKDITHIEAFALAGEDEIVKRFRIILRSGEVIAVPYALLPIIILTEDSELIIRAYGLLITINGRNMRGLHEYISSESLIWMKESQSGKDTGDDFIFISKISVVGRTASKSLREGEE